MALSKGLLHLSGRKKESCVWDYFVYDSVADTATCIVNVKSGHSHNLSSASTSSAVSVANNTGQDQVSSQSTEVQKCGRILVGKNSTNLRTHLKLHPLEFKEFETKEEKRKAVATSSMKSKDSKTLSTHPQTVMTDFVGKNKTTAKLWNRDSPEYKKRRAFMVSFFASTLQPAHLADSPEFKALLSSFEPRFQPPGSKALNRQLEMLVKNLKATMIRKLHLARKVTVCLDIWTTKGLTASFLGISACFFCPDEQKAQHAFLALRTIGHPHTGAMIANCLTDTLNEWKITPEQVLIVITDNGANMMKAVKCMNEKLRADRENADDHDDEDGEVEESEDESGSNSSDNECTDVTEENQQSVTVLISMDEIQEALHYCRMPCQAHSLQLVVKEIEKNKGANTLLQKARRICKAVRKSSVAVEQLLEKCNKRLLIDCPTRWNSSLMMMQRMLEIKTSLNSVLAMNEIDGLLSSEWVHMEELCKLLDPFGHHTNLLQADTAVLSNVLPAILDLEAHLLATNTCKVLASAMLRSLRQRFNFLLNPTAADYNPLIAAACLMDPTVAGILLAPEMADHLRAAKLYVLSQVH